MFHIYPTVHVALEARNVALRLETVLSTYLRILMAQHSSFQPGYTLLFSFFFSFFSPTGVGVTQHSYTLDFLRTGLDLGSATPQAMGYGLDDMPFSYACWLFFFFLPCWSGGEKKLLRPPLSLV